MINLLYEVTVITIRPMLGARFVVRILSKSLLIIITVVLTIYIALSTFGAYKVMGIPRLPLLDSPSSVELDYEDVTFTSRVDNVLLKGWYIPGQNEFVIIILQGGFQNRVDSNVNTLGLAQDLNEEGFSLLMFDLRGRGESEGEGRTLLNTELDLGGAIDYLKHRGYSDESIGIIGFCSGAAASAIYASQEHVGALVLDGCFTNVRSIFKAQAALEGIPDFLVDLFFPGVSLLAKLLYGYTVINPIDIVATISCPILFIHEENDNTITLENAHSLFKASVSTKDKLWIVPNVEHSQGYRLVPFEYIEKVSDFFIKSMGG